MSIKYIKSSSCPEHQLLIHPVSIGHSYDALQIPLTHHVQRQINEFFLLFQIYLLPVFTILVKRTTVKSILKDRKLEVLSFHTSNWSPNPIDSTLLISHILPLSVLSVRIFVQILSISGLSYCNGLLTLSLPPYLLVIHPPWLKSV